MNIFADKAETYFYKTDEYLKNLHKIEINSIDDFIYRYNFDPLILLDLCVLKVSRFDELISCKYEDAHYSIECADIDFIKNLNPIDIFEKVLKIFIEKFDDNSIVELLSDVAEEKGKISLNIEKNWLDDDEIQWKISHYQNDRELAILTK